MAQLVEELCYKPEGRGFGSRWCHGNFSLTYSFRPHCGAGVDSASNRNEYQEYFLGGKGGRSVGLTTLPHLLPIVLKSGSLYLPGPSGPVQACTEIAFFILRIYTYIYMCVCARVHTHVIISSSALRKPLSISSRLYRATAFHEMSSSARSSPLLPYSIIYKHIRDSEV